MKPVAALFSVSLLLVLIFAGSAQTTDNYQPGPDSKPQPGVPKGELLKFTLDKSKIFPGTTRDYWIYVPAQYKHEGSHRVVWEADKRVRDRWSHPLPLSDWDYRLINLNFLGKSPQLWRDLGVQYIYALALDDCRQSKRLLDAMVKSATGFDENTFLSHAIQRVNLVQPTRLLLVKKDLAKLVLDHAFFLSSQDQKQVSARLLGLSGKKDKALVEVYINRGRLAEEWYHVVIRKCRQGWKFFSITPVAVS
jgi:hypothetical protein